MRWSRAPIAALVATLNVLGFAVLVAEQATEWSTTWDTSALLWWVGGTTLVIGIVLVALVMLAGSLLPSWRWRLVIAGVLAAVQALVRAVLLLPATTAEPGLAGGATIWATGMIGYSVALGAGFLVAVLLEREDRERARREAEEDTSRQAIAELESEELRVRRMVADRLHGAVQHRLVVIASGLDGAAAALEQGAGGAPEQGSGVASDQEAGTRWAPQLRSWAEELDELREEHVRSLSHSLFPSGADLGTYEAIRALLDRLPTSVAASVVLGPRMQEHVHAHRALLPLLDRLVVVYTVEEAVTNALKHGGATTVVVTVEIEPREGSPWLLDLVVDDDGRGPESPSPQLSGLARHRSRAQARGGSLELQRSPDGGGRLHLTLPFTPEIAG